MSFYLMDFQEIDKTNLAQVGGKGANLGELSKIDKIQVPDGFCVSTEAFKEIVGKSPQINELLDKLALLSVEDRTKVGELSGQIRRIIEETAIPQNIEEAITRRLSLFGENDAFAIRSSATAEDLPDVSFAGQQDSYLNIIGKEAVLKHISKCWASLFTDRAVIYRLQNGFDHRQVAQAVVVQKMVFPDVSGIMFTADPVTSNRKIVSIDAGFGLGEALVSGLVNADNYKVSNGRIVSRKISDKKLAIYAVKDGGTEQRKIETEKQNTPALTAEQILQLEQIGRKIEKHFGTPQDIEWCLVNETFYIVQSRPITTLFPIPEVDDNENHVYISVGHQQMMTDPFKPLGSSLWRMTAFHKAGGRLFVDVTNLLASAAGRENLLKSMGQHDPLMKDALLTIIERKDFIKLQEQNSNNADKVPAFAHSQPPIENDPAIVNELIESSQKSLEELKQSIRTKSGAELFEFIDEDIKQLKKGLVESRTMSVILAVMAASGWINEKMFEWLGEKNAADTLSQSVSNNVTSEMGLALLDVADVIRPFPDLIEYLQNTKDDNFLDELTNFEGGIAAKNAIDDFLDKYGMRCSGEIDITRTRWSEKPSLIIPLILNNIKNFAPNESNRRFAQGFQKAFQKEKELLERLRKLPDGEQKAEEAKQKISLSRNFAGYREYPKYAIVSRYFAYKQALLKEIEPLVEAGVIIEKDDIYYLSFEELRDVVTTKKLDYRIINQRKDEYKHFEKLTPPRVITSDGEIITGEYKRENLPADAIVGLAVSTGVVEGRARVILNMEDADLEDGDILVTSFTDPSWTPLFISIKGLVTEVGGLMTHGAVIAREYGLPAVVGVENATKLIKDGQRIRVNGTEGFIEII